MVHYFNMSQSHFLWQLTYHIWLLIYFYLVFIYSLVIVFSKEVYNMRLDPWFWRFDATQVGIFNNFSRPFFTSPMNQNSIPNSKLLFAKRKISLKTFSILGYKKLTLYSWGVDLILGLLRVKSHRQPKNRLSVANTDRWFLGCLKLVQAA